MAKKFQIKKTDLPSDYPQTIPKEVKKTLQINQKQLRSQVRKGQRDG